MTTSPLLLAGLEPRTWNVILALVAAFAIAVAVTVDWPHIWPKWRPFLAAVAIQQAVIAYGSWEANRAGAELGVRVLLLALSLLALIATALLVVFGRHDHRADVRRSGAGRA